MNAHCSTNHQAHTQIEKLTTYFKSESLLTKKKLLAEGLSDMCFNVSPWLTQYSNYPDLADQELKMLYLKFLNEIEKESALFLNEDSNGEPSSKLNLDQLLLCRGISDAINLCFQTFCLNSAETIVIHEPTFSLYEHLANLKGHKIHKLNLFGTQLNELNLNFNDWSQIKKAKLIFFCRPNNPTGTNISLEQIASIARQTAGLLIIDEAYIEFSNEASALRLLQQHRNIIILRTFSKAWGLAGLRCGMILAAPQLIETLSNSLGPFVLPQPVQVALLEKLRNQKYVFNHIKYIKNERNILLSLLNKLPSNPHYFSTETNFITLQIPQSQSLYDTFLKLGLLIEKTFIGTNPTLRITISSPSNNSKISEIIWSFYHNYPIELDII